MKRYSKIVSIAQHGYLYWVIYAPGVGQDMGRSSAITVVVATMPTQLFVVDVGVTYNDI